MSAVKVRHTLRSHVCVVGGLKGGTSSHQFSSTGTQLFLFLFPKYVENKERGLRALYKNLI